MGSKPWTNPFPKTFGGGKQDRTADLLHAMQALSQLSYTPKPETLQLIPISAFLIPEPSIIA